MKKYLLSAAALMLGISVVATAAANPPPKEDDKDPKRWTLCHLADAVPPRRVWIEVAAAGRVTTATTSSTRPT